MEKFLGFPDLASVHGAQLDHLVVVVHWLMLVLFVGWGSFFLFTLLRFRAGNQPKANYHGVTSHYSSYLEIGMAVFEAFLLIGFSIPLWASRVNEFPADKDAVVVRIVAEQFSWNIWYPGPDGVFGKAAVTLVSSDNPLGLDATDPAGADDITSINQLVLPVDKPCIVHLTTKDVIHSLNLPVMRIKQDAIPGMSIPAWFTPNKIGKYEIACAQLCGLGHYRMRGYMNIESQADYNAWMAEQAAAKSKPAN